MKKPAIPKSIVEKAGFATAYDHAKVEMYLRPERIVAVAIVHDSVWYFK